MLWLRLCWTIRVCLSLCLHGIRPRSVTAIWTTSAMLLWRCYWPHLSSLSRACSGANTARNTETTLRKMNSNHKLPPMPAQTLIIIHKPNKKKQICWKLNKEINDIYTFMFKSMLKENNNIIEIESNADIYLIEHSQ